MDRSTYPFPLAVNSSHHSHYHRFLLGADASILAPFPKPYCVGSLSAPLRILAENLNLSKWRKLYSGAIPWVEGFGPAHYDLGNVAPHRPLPRAYGRPVRKFGAFDLVQVADPSVSALALVAGDRRVLDRFVALGDAFSSRVETGAGSRGPGPSGLRITGRMLAGQFFEPNNRWLMPFLHVHTRVLNFTSFGEAPARLTCIDPCTLARAAEKAKQGWASLQAEALLGLGYKVALRGETVPTLRVEGVSGRLLAAVEAPRIAVLRLLERIVAGDCHRPAERLASELPIAVIAAMADQLESVLARSLSWFKPAKIGIPSEGPWRGAVREHLSGCCPDALAGIDAAALQARAVVSESAIFPTPPLDPAHRHAPDALEAGCQMPTDPELGASHAPPDGADRAASQWLASEFTETLRDVNQRLLRVGPGDTLAPFRGLIAAIDNQPLGAEPEQLRQSALFLGAEIERMEKRPAIATEIGWRPGRADSRSLSSLDELFASACMERAQAGHGIGGRSL